MHWVPTPIDELYMAACRQLSHLELPEQYARLQALPAAQELPDRWLEPVVMFESHEVGVLMCGMLHCAIEVDPRLRFMVVNGRQDTLRALLGLPPAGSSAILGGPLAQGQGIRSGVSRMEASADQATVPAGKQRVKREETMAQQMKRYNELADYANSIGVSARRLGGPAGDKTFATYDAGQRAIEKLTKKIREKEAGEGAPSAA